MSKPSKVCTAESLRPSTLVAAGTAVVSNTGDEIERVMRALDAAGSVVPRFGDNAADVKAWKLACGINYAAFDRAANELAMRVRDVMRETDNDPGWKEAAENLANAGRKALGEDVPVDALLALLFEDEESTRTLVGAYGQKAIDELKGCITFQGVSCVEHARWTSIQVAGSMLVQPVQVQVLMVSWNRVPGALSGGYMRELAWMFTHVPDCIKALVDAAVETGTSKPENVSVGVDSSDECATLAPMKE